MSNDHRLYLDSADLFAIGDGDVADGTIVELRRMMAERKTCLVVSKAHIQDAIWADADSVQRFVSAVKRFDPILLVVDGPAPFEEVDIRVEFCTNFDELIASEAARPWRALMTELQDCIHAGNAAAQRLATTCETLNQVLSTHASDLALRCYITLAGGWKGGDPEPILQFWETEYEPLRSHERPVVLARLAIANEHLKAIAPFASRHGLDLRDVLRHVASTLHDPVANPGQALAHSVATQLQRDARRRRRRSDSVDLEHIRHFPYVDVATCDRQVYPIINRTLPRAPTRRTPVVVRNGHIEDVIAAVRQLPIQ